MINRRQFFGGLSGVATAAGIVGSSTADVRQLASDKRLDWIPEYERKLAEFQELEVLGIPRSWWHVCQGLHPFSPERTVIVNPDSPREDIDRWIQKLVHDKVSRAKETDFDRFGLSTKKVELLLNMVEPMAAAYGDEDRFKRWMIQLARRESFSPSGVGGHVAILHQFQAPPWPRTTNGLVDWWLFLIPNGGEFDSLDEEPVHLAFACVVSRMVIKGHCYFHQELKALELFSRVLKLLGPSGIISLSKMDRYSAAQFLNRRLVEEL